MRWSFVYECTVVMSPRLMPKVSCSTFATGARQFVVQDAFEITSCFPASNVVFTAQDDPATVKPADDPSTSPNPLSSAYGQWTAVENAGIAIAEGANLLTIPGRMCSSGRPAPIQNADWQKFVAGLRAAGMQVYKAALAKDLDQITSAADTVTTACGNCHDVYREKTPAQGGPKNRCIAN